MAKQAKKKVTDKVDVKSKEDVKSKVIMKKVLLTKDYFSICNGEEIKGKAGETIEMPESHYDKTVIYYTF